jgi:hypothetical protein
MPQLLDPMSIVDLLMLLRVIIDLDLVQYLNYLGHLTKTSLQKRYLFTQRRNFQFWLSY